MMNKEENKSQSFLSFVLIRYSWLGFLIILLGICYLLLPIPHLPPVSPIEISDWNFKSIPSVICHLTDIHVAGGSIDSIDRTIETFSLISKFHPDFIIITGDIADNCENGNRPRYCDQKEVDYLMYRQLIQNYLPNFTNLIEIAGNHDVFGVYNFSSSSHYFQKNVFTIYDNSSNYALSQRKIGNITFILMNPYNFPSAHPAFVFWGHPSVHFMDKLESMLADLPSSETIILLAHYPISMFIHAKTSSGKTIQELVSDPKISFILTGHTHRYTPLLHQGVLEVIGKSTPGFGLLVNDNGRFSYHSFKMKFKSKLLSKQFSSSLKSFLNSATFNNNKNNNKNNKNNNKNNNTNNKNNYKNNNNKQNKDERFSNLTIIKKILENYQKKNSKKFQKFLKPIVTFPISENVISSRADFANKNFPIRVLSFDQRDHIIDPLNISVVFDNHPEKRIQLKLMNQFGDSPLIKAVYGIESIYSYFQLNSGRHYISFEGDMDEHFHFIINETYTPNELQKKEYYQVRYPILIVFIALFGLGICIAFITFPLNIFTIPFYSLSKYYNSYISCILYGPLILRTQFQKMGLITRIIIHLASICYIIIPISLIEIEGKNGFIWLYGYYCDNHFYYAEWGMIYCLFYLLMVVRPVLSLSLYITDDSSRYAIINLIDCVFGIVFNIYGLFRWLVESVGWNRLFFSPLFVLSPILCYIILIIEKNCYTKEHHSDSEDELVNGGII